MIPRYVYLRMRTNQCSHNAIMQFASVVDGLFEEADESDWSGLCNLYMDTYNSNGISREYGGIKAGDSASFISGVLKDMIEAGLIKKENK